MIFVVKDVYRLVFEGRFFGSVQNIWGNPNINSTTILFDVYLVDLLCIPVFNINYTVGSSLPCSAYTAYLTKMFPSNVTRIATIWTSRGVLCS